MHRTTTVCAPDCAPAGIWTTRRHCLVLWSNEFSIFKTIPGNPGVKVAVTPSWGICPGVPMVLQAPPSIVTVPPGTTVDGVTVGAVCARAGTAKPTPAPKKADKAIVHSVVRQVRTRVIRHPPRSFGRTKLSQIALWVAGCVSWSRSRLPPAAPTVGAGRRQGRWCRVRRTGRRREPRRGYRPHRFGRRAAAYLCVVLTRFAGQPDMRPEPPCGGRPDVRTRRG